MIISQRTRAATMPAAMASASAAAGSGAEDRLRPLRFAFAPAANSPIQVPKIYRLPNDIHAEIDPHRWTGESGGRLDRLLAAHVAELSRTRLKALIEAGAVAVDGRTIRDPGYRVNSGAAILVDIPRAVPAKPAAEPIPLKVIYEDDDIIVIDKPKGLVVHPAAGNWTGTLVNALIAHCGDSLSGIGGERRPGIVHRLDKDTTGLMVVAKNDRAHRALAAQFAGHGRGGGPFERGYLAFVWGAPDRPRGTIDRPIDRHPQCPQPHGDPRRRTRGRHPLASARALWRDESEAGAARANAPASRWQAFSPAGSKPAAPTRFGSIWPRSAIRSWAMMSMDRDFAPRRPCCPKPAQIALKALGRQALHAHILTVEHPITGKILRLRSELPADLTRLHNGLAAMRAEPGGK